MRYHYLYMRTNLCHLTLLFLGFLLAAAAGAQLSLREVVIYGGKSRSCPAGLTAPPAPGCGVSISSSAIILSGSVATYKVVKTSSGVRINGNIYSDSTVELGNENRVGGWISVGNIGRVTAAAL